jgi:hypothetical protein
MTTTDITVVVSSLLGEGMQDFVSVVEETLADMAMSIEVRFPWRRTQYSTNKGNVEVVCIEKRERVRAKRTRSGCGNRRKFNVYRPH